MEIFLIQEGQQTGPFTADSVQAMIAEGRVRAQDIGWRKGLAGWMPLSEVLNHWNGTGAEAPGRATAETANGVNGKHPEEPEATAKQKALLSFLGAEFASNISKRTAALAICDAMENPRLQRKLRKWQDEKWHLHPDVFQDEIDFRKANRVAGYLELCQTEGAEVVNDVTKAHVQVIVESLDKKYPKWETEPHAALWDYLLPAIVEHFPKLMRPDWKGRLHLGGTSKVAATAAAKAGTPVGAPIPRPVASVIAQPTAPPAPPSALAAAGRGLVYGLLVLGLIIGGNYGYQQWQASKAKAAPESPQPTPAPVNPGTPSSEPAPPAAEKPAPVVPAEVPPPAAPEPAPAAPPAPEAKMPVPAPEPAAPMAESKPPLPEVKPMPAEASPPAEMKPAMAEEKPADPRPAQKTPVPPRTAVKLVQGIGVALPNGNVTLPAGTELRFIAMDGPNVRVSWNNNVFDVPAAATDVGDAPASVPPGIPEMPAAPATPMKKPGAKPSDDL